MGDLLFYIAAFIFVIALIVLGGWLWRTLLENGVELPGNNLFKSPKDKRIGTIETAGIDGKRKLVLIRRDNVEHLILTGGPVDVVIETGIEAKTASNTERQSAPALSGDSYDSAALEKRLFGSKRADANSSSSFLNGA